MYSSSGGFSDFFLDFLLDFFSDSFVGALSEIISDSFSDVQSFFFSGSCSVFVFMLHSLPVCRSLGCLTDGDTFAVYLPDMAVFSAVYSPDSALFSAGVC